MLAITPQMRILVAVEAVDFRKGIDSLAELCRAKLNADPFSGSVFVFRSLPNPLISLPQIFEVKKLTSVSIIALW